MQTVRFQAFWGTDRASEKQAFEQFIDFVIERLERFPDLHVYHYAPYEATAIKRLMGLHATREAEVDRLLRGKVLVDLYTVVRQGLRIGQPNYSIKSVEAFYMGKRDTEVAEGGDSIVAFERYLETGDEALLEGIERYNEDDCRSTHLLREWLLERREQAIERFGEIPWRAPGAAEHPDPELEEEIDALGAALSEGIPEETEDRDDGERARWLMAQLIDYHRREAKPGWWAYFERMEADEEQLDGARQRGFGEVDRRRGDRSDPIAGALALGVAHAAVSRAGAQDRGGQGRRSRDGQAADGRVAGQRDGNAEDQAGSRARRRAPPPRADPGWPVRHSFATRGVAPTRGGHRRARDRRSRALQRASRDSARADPEHDRARPLARPCRRASSTWMKRSRSPTGLEDSYLFIQGPPGSGKTYTGAHLILHLIERGHRVGVASGTHAAIHNLLTKVEEQAPAGASFRGLKKCGSDGGNSYEPKRGLIGNSKENADFAGGDYELVAGTAWLFCREELDATLDYLVIDEAGQISLADALAMGTCARNVILLGDPQQLAQVSQAVHPPGAGVSVLEHLLGETRRSRRSAGFLLTRRGGCTRTCAGSSRRRSTRTGWSPLRTARTSASTPRGS